jgi:hypothetical protein
MSNPILQDRPVSLALCSTNVPSTIISHDLSLDPRQPVLLHLHSQLQDVIDALTLRLRLMHVLAPDISGVSSAYPPRALSSHTHIPCRLTNTAQVSGYSSIAFSKLSVKSSSCAVFSIIGIVSVSKKPRLPASRPLGIPLICSMHEIWKGREEDWVEGSWACSMRSVTRTAHCECVWIQQPAPRLLKAA